MNNSHMGGMKKVAHIGKDAKGNIESWGDIFTNVDRENANQVQQSIEILKDNVTKLGGMASSDDGYTYKVC